MFFYLCAAHPYVYIQDTKSSPLQYLKEIVLWKGAGYWPLTTLLPSRGKTPLCQQQPQQGSWGRKGQLCHREDRDLVSLWLLSSWRTINWHITCRVKMTVFQAFFWVQKTCVLPIFRHGEADVSFMRISPIYKTSSVSVTMSNIKIFILAELFCKQLKKEKEILQLNNSGHLLELSGVRLFLPA